MHPSWAWKLPIFFGLLLVAAFFSVAESSLFSLGKYRLQRLHRFSARKFAILEKLLESPTKLISTLLVGNELSNIALEVIGASIIYDHFTPRGEDSHPLLPLLTVAILLPVVIVVSELIPKAYGLKNSEKVALWSAQPLWFFYRWIAPLRSLIQWLPDRLLRFFRIPPKSNSVSEQVFRVLVDRGHEEGVLDSQEKQLIHNVFKIDDLVISEIMTPLAKVASLSEDMDVEQCLAVIQREGYSRYPVLDADRSRAVGVLYAKDLLGAGDGAKDAPLRSYLRSAFVVQHSTLVIEVFFQFKMKRTHFAVVLEEGTARILGVVTLEDILEEIFGDLKDERDQA